MGEKRYIGPHEIWFEAETGFVVIVQCGRVEEEHAQELAETFAAYRRNAQGEPAFILSDSRRATGVSSEARRIFMKDSRWNDFEGYLVVIGASFLMRTLSNMLFKAAEVSSRSKLTAICVATEEEGRAWLSEQQRAYFDARVSA